MANHTPNQSKKQSYNPRLKIDHKEVPMRLKMATYYGSDHIPTREEAQDLIDEINEFYATHSDDAIDTHNLQVEIELDPEYYGLKRWEIQRIQDEAFPERAARRAMMEQKSKRVQDNRGYVYLLKADNGTYKIGKSKDPANRLKTFSVKLPYAVEYVALIKTDDMRGLEADLHEMFHDCRLDGEWFDLSAEAVEYIKGMAE